MGGTKINHFFSGWEIEQWAAFCGVVLFVGGLLAWFYKIAKKVDDTFSYVDELRTNHLPHLQRAIELILKHLGIEAVE